MEEIERPSFENFLSKPTNLTDHLAWQLGALSLSRAVREAAEQIIGNLNEDGYLIASDEEMLGVAPPAPPEADAAAARNIASEAQALGLVPDEVPDEAQDEVQAEVLGEATSEDAGLNSSASTTGADELNSGPSIESEFSATNLLTGNSFDEVHGLSAAALIEPFLPGRNGNSAAAAAPAPEPAPRAPRPVYKATFTPADLRKPSK